jgi:hypothetical protein
MNFLGTFFMVFLFQRWWFVAGLRQRFWWCSWSIAKGVVVLVVFVAHCIFSSGVCCSSDGFSGSSLLRRLFFVAVRCSVLLVLRCGVGGGLRLWGGGEVLRCWCGGVWIWRNRCVVDVLWLIFYDTWFSDCFQIHWDLQDSFWVSDGFQICWDLQVSLYLVDL